MKLSLIKDLDVSITVIQDCDFENMHFDLRDPLPSTISFCTSQHFLNECLNNNNIVGIIITPELFSQCSGLEQFKDKGVVITPRPEEAFFRFHNYLFEKRQPKSKSKTFIGEHCKIASTAVIDEYNVTIGDNVIIEDFVRIYENTKIGDNSIIRAGSIIGNEGFQFYKLEKQIIPIRHIGGVIIGRDVELQSMCAVDKSIFNGNTIIGDETKFDNYVHFAHGSRIGCRCRVAAKAMIAGNVFIGDDVWIGPSSAISSSLNIGNGASITIGSVVTRDVPPNGHVTGNFAIDHKKFLENLKKLR